MSRRHIKNNTLELLDGENNAVLSVFVFLRENVMVMELKGQIKNEVAHSLGDEIDSASFACERLEIDMSGVSYIAGMGLEILGKTQSEIESEAGPEIVLTNVPEVLAAKLREAGYGGRIEIIDRDGRG